VRRLFPILLCIALLPVRAHATVFTAMDDATLVSASDAVVTGRVTDVVARKRGRRIVTETTVSVARVLKGHVGNPSIVVTTPGGHVGDDWVVVFGVPELSEGDDVLLCLRRTRRGELRTTAMAMGAFRLGLGADGRTLAERRLVFAEVRGLDEFASMAQALGDPGTDVTVTAPVDEPDDVTERFEFLGDPPSRWFEADQHQPIRYGVANSDTELGAMGSQQVVDAAFGAWNDVPTANIVLQRGGNTQTAPSIAGGVCDGKNTIQFDDPEGEIDALSGCNGILAVGGFCPKSQTGIFDGQSFRHIAEGDLTINNGVANCLDRKGYEEVVTHEVGHTIGLAHSSENPHEPNFQLEDATMYFLVHLDGRGASVHADDIAGVTALYRMPTNPNDLDGDGIANANDDCPTTPPNTPVDANGCGCDEVGHAFCDDGLSCTSDRCNPATGRCTADPIDCTGGEPCVTGTCDELTGCSTTPVTGDTAVLCVYSRSFPPGSCTLDRIPRGLKKRFDKARRLATTGVRKGDPRFFQRAGATLDKARAMVDRAATRRRRPLSGGCAEALDALIDDAHARLTPLD
jgi:hypothetical protein